MKILKKLDIYSYLKYNSKNHELYNYIQAGNLKALKWFHYNKPELFTKKHMNWAAENGNLEVVKLLHSNLTEVCTKEAIDLAAENGHLEIVKWLYKNQTEGYGHLEVVKWLCNTI